MNDEAHYPAVSRAKAAKSRISSSLTPRKITTFTLKEESGSFRRVHRGKYGRQVATSSNRIESIDSQRITTDVYASQSGTSEIRGEGANNMPLVVSERS